MFFMPILVGVWGFYIWLWRYRSEVPWRLVLKHLAMSIGIILLISGWWYVLCFVRYGVVFISDEMMDFSYMVKPLGLDLTLISFSGHMIRNLAGFFTSFLWSGTWSWIPRNLTTNLLYGPLIVLVLLGAYRSFKFKNREITFWMACIFILTSLILGFVNHMYLIVKFTGVGSGVGGYYLFIIWPVIGSLAALCFKNTETLAGKYALIVSFGLVLIFEISGWWLLLQTFAGVVEKTGYLNRGIGSISFTPANMMFVLERLKGLTFPYLANILFVSSLLLKMALLWVVVFLYKPLISHEFTKES